MCGRELGNSTLAIHFGVRACACFLVTHFNTTEPKDVFGCFGSIVHDFISEVDYPFKGLVHFFDVNGML